MQKTETIQQQQVSNLIPIKYHGYYVLQLSFCLPQTHSSCHLIVNKKNFQSNWYINKVDYKYKRAVRLIRI